MIPYLACSFLAAFVAVQVLRHDLSLQNDPISAYLTGPFGWFLDAGFVFLAAALVWLSLASDGWAALGFAAGSLGVLWAMLTKRIPAMLGQNIDAPPWEPLHLLAAAAGFIGTWTGELVFSVQAHLQFGFLLAAVQGALALLFVHFHSTKTAILEKLEILLIVTWLIFFGGNLS